MSTNGSVLRYFEGSSGNRLAADQEGPADGQPVLLLHGGGQTRHSWARARQALARAGYLAIAVDARGHGESDWIENGNYRLDSQVGDLKSIIATLDNRPALVGASMGGVNSLIACGAQPDIASLLIMVDVTPRLEAQGIERIKDFMLGNPDGFASLDEAAEAVATYNSTHSRAGSRDGLRKNLRLGEDGRWRWHWDPQFMLGDFRTTVQEISQRMFDAAENVAVPTLLIRGQQSDVVSPEGVAEMRKLMPKMEFTDVQGAGHMVAGDRNDVFNGAMLDFMKRHLPALA
ncbi:MAG TPA: alpha/beta hydrolase [Pseudomonas xinjiangensis]|uniref:Alpha/beta hydrolase n=2 Tax=root TaxID=1 RepID=A0A7V1FTA0_9GAMM|nr:alpha/beta hydrolase [Halopseudomonas xinjiangensis]HEC47367.1 alpha/beta hydrolase [Halopseudomonas xinjiangensis]